MNNKYTASEVIEIGKAQEVILGAKDPSIQTDVEDFRLPSDNDLDD